MADVKISDLTDGSPIESGDLVEIERPGSPNVSRKAGLGTAAGMNVGTTAGTVAAGNHSHSDATTSVSGFMSATDKTKLDGIEAGADVTDTTNVAAAGAIMDGDFSSNGLMTRTGAGTYSVTAIGTTAGTVAAGDDSRITGALQSSNVVSQSEAEAGTSTTPRAWTAERVAQAIAALGGGGGGGASAAFKAVKTATQSPGAETYTKITFPSEVFDVGSHYDTTNSRWTPPAGPVCLIVSINRAAINDWTILDIYKNGSRIGAEFVGLFEVSSTAAERGPWCIVHVDNANGTDYYEAYYYSDSSVNRTIIATSTNAQVFFAGFSL